MDFDKECSLTTPIRVDDTPRARRAKDMMMSLLWRGGSEEGDVGVEMGKRNVYNSLSKRNSRKDDGERKENGESRATWKFTGLFLL